MKGRELLNIKPINPLPIKQYSISSFSQKSKTKLLPIEFILSKTPYRNHAKYKNSINFV
jgi:hypothetical protein